MFSLDTLNEQQKLIAMDTEGAKLVTAGAGSGKTRLLTHRICYIIDEKRVSPSNILAITFTNKATNEMKERIAQMIPYSTGITIRTFHSLCASILRENIHRLDGFDSNFSVYDDSDSEKLLKKVMKELSVSDDIAKKCGYHISKAKNLGLNPDEYLKENKFDKDIDIICKVYAEYQRQLKNNNALDFDDLLLKTLELFYESPDTLSYYQNKFQYIHVDEFQDTNLVQYKIIKLISAKYKNIFVVGDEDQCIYCWRGANIENINSFIRDFDAKIYKLEQNYRSTKKIIATANKLIKNNYSRIDKTLYTDNPDGEEITYYEGYNENEEAEYVARAIYKLHTDGVPLNHIGVLMRISALSRLMEEKLLNYNIPYRVSGIFKFFERMEIKNVLAYLTMIVNPRDNSSILRIINFPKRGIGQATIDKLTSMAEESRVSLVELIENYRMLDISPTIKNKIAELGDLITDLKNAYETKELYDFVQYVVEKTEIKNVFNTDSEEDIDRIMNIDQLLQSVKSYEHLNDDANLIDYLESVTLQSTLDDEDDNELSVSISTVHASKGLEFDYVFIIGLEEGKFPLSRAMDSMEELEEERRLMYVAVTRAKKKLYITRAKQRFMYGRTEYQSPSRFVKEMGLGVIHPDSVNNYGYSRYYSGDYCESKPTYSNYSSSMQNKQKSNNDEDYFTYSSYIKTKQEYRTDENKIDNLQTLMTSKLNNQKKKFADYKVGVQVLHTKFGVGTIVKVEDVGGNNYCSVDFGKLGVKTLSLNFAPLQILKK